MIFATFLPMPEHEYKEHKVPAVFEEVLGYEPIFCFPARTADEFAFGCFLSQPQYPGRIVLFESFMYDRFDMVKYQALRAKGEENITADKLRECFDGVEEKYAEYVVPEMTEVYIDISLHEFIFETEFPNDENKHIDLIMQRTRLEYEGMIQSLKTAPDEQQTCLFLKTAFTYFCSRFFYGGVMNDSMAFEDALPFFPTHNNMSAVNAFSHATNQAIAIFGGNGSHKTFDDMYKNLMNATASLYEDYYEHYYCREGRNGPCACGSGLKFKKCHARWRGQLKDGVI